MGLEPRDPVFRGNRSRDWLCTWLPGNCTLCTLFYKVNGFLYTTLNLDM